MNFNSGEAPRYRQFMPGQLELNNINSPYPPTRATESAASSTMDHNISNTCYYIASPSPSYMSPTYPMMQQKQVFTFDQGYNAAPKASWHTPQMRATVYQTQNVNNYNIQWTSNVQNPQIPAVNLQPAHQNVSSSASLPSESSSSSSYSSPIEEFNQSIRQRQPFTSRDNMTNYDSRNKLRSEIFDRILGTFPKLQRMMAHSNQRIKREQPEKLSPCMYSGVPSRSSLASDIMDEENDMGYSSFTDVSPVNSAINSPLADHEESSSLNQILEDVLNCVDDLRDLKDLVSDIDDKSCDHAKPNVAKDTVAAKPKKKNVTISAIKEDSFQKFQCDQCDKNFATRANLNLHVRSHNGDRPHKCHYCGKSFTQKSTLRTHIRIHTGERPYKCKECPKAFSDYSTFTKHSRTHTGERPYSCSVCGKGFAQSGNMIRHRQMHFKNDS